MEITYPTRLYGADADANVQQLWSYCYRLAGQLNDLCQRMEQMNTTGSVRALQNEMTTLQESVNALTSRVGELEGRE